MADVLMEVVVHTPIVAPQGFEDVPMSVPWSMQHDMDAEEGFEWQFTPSPLLPLTQEIFGLASQRERSRSPSAFGLLAPPAEDESTAPSTPSPGSRKRIKRKQAPPSHWPEALLDEDDLAATQEIAEPTASVNDALAVYVKDMRVKENWRDAEFFES